LCNKDGGRTALLEQRVVDGARDEAVADAHLGSWAERASARASGGEGEIRASARASDRERGRETERERARAIGRRETRESEMEGGCSYAANEPASQLPS
jgi:hypothetical protein